MTASIVRKCVYAQIVFLLWITEAHSFIIDPDFTPWQVTASGPRFGRGIAGTLTWSIVPDGTRVSDGQSSLGGSDLLDFLNEQFDGDTDQTDHTQQPWFPIFEDAFGRWDELSGLTLNYEPNDDGGNHSERDGLLGVRGDLRVSGASVDGSGGILAFNFFPEFGGDMTLDTDDTGFTRTTSNFRFFRNTIMHELGHAFNLSHVTSDSDRLLMEASTDTVFDGPQLDEVRGIHYYFGDKFEGDNDGEGNNELAMATDLGALSLEDAIAIGEDADRRNQRISGTTTDFVSISHGQDVDFYSFTLEGHGILSTQLTPLGGTFTQTGEFGIPTPFDASARMDLAFAILNADGDELVPFIDEVAAGESESVDSLELAPGTYFVEIDADDVDSVQLYMLELELSPRATDCNADGFTNGDDLSCACGAGLESVLSEIGSIAGDFNVDGIVDFADFLVLSTNFATGSGYHEGDVDCDGEVAFADFLVLSTNFGASIQTSGLASVPEPSHSWLVALASIFLFRRRMTRRANAARQLT